MAKEYKRYLDPKADLTFKKVFGEHKDLVISLINALLPLTDDQQVESVEYLAPEMPPVTPLKKNSIVDVRCRDVRGRQFLVEMQMIWTPAFQQRVLFNASKAFVRQLDSSRQYEMLEPVYSLNLVNDVFMNDYPHEFIHNYNVVHELHSDRVIEGLHLTFVELPKFEPQSIEEKKMTVLWLRFLTEIDERTRDVPADLLENPATAKALRELEESAFSDDELFVYEDFWDKVGAERLLFIDSEKRGFEQGRERGMEEGKVEGRAEGRAEGRDERNIEVARNLKNLGATTDMIARATGLTEEEILRLV